MKSCRIGFEDKADFVSYAAKLLEDFFVAVICLCGVVKTPVITRNLCRKHRACLIGISAYCDHSANFSAEIFAHVLRGVARNIDANFCHDFDCQGMHVTSWV